MGKPQATMVFFVHVFKSIPDRKKIKIAVWNRFPIVTVSKVLCSLSA
jgi:hypothetical protein